ncbi:MAG TPA: PLP-dependent aminotransferase family protein [Stellaceae bacterium]|nr:PLP-dependent aminotransferase family protein [Stellaceae bacterium]
MKDGNSLDRVIQHLRAEIAGSPAGSRLPSVRALMSRHGVGPVTVQRAFDRLAGEGVIDAQPGRGTFVAPREAPAAGDFAWQSGALGAGRVSADALGELVSVPPVGTLALSAGYPPPELQALPQLAAAMQRALRRPGVWDRLPPAGLEPLRAWFASEIGGGFAANDIIICAGGQSAIGTAFRALAEPGAAILMESPTYIGAITAARAAGLKPVPVPGDAEGVDPDLLGAALARSGARVVYCQPAFANPSGAVLSAPRRAALLERLASAGAFLVEDDWARDFGLDGPPPAPLIRADRDGHIVYIRSLTKSAAPGLRIAAIAARGAAMQRLRSIRTIDDLFLAGPMQEAALQLVTAPAWPRHLRRLRSALRARRDHLAASLRRQFGAASLPLVPAGGLHLWLHLPPAVSDRDLAASARAAGLLVSPGRPWFPAEPTGSFLRLSFAAAPPDALDRGVTILAGLVGFDRQAEQTVFT